MHGSRRGRQKAVASHRPNRRGQALARPPPCCRPSDCAVKVSALQTKMPTDQVSLGYVLSLVTFFKLYLYHCDNKHQIPRCHLAMSMLFWRFPGRNDSDRQHQFYYVMLTSHATRALSEWCGHGVHTRLPPRRLTPW